MSMNKIVRQTHRWVSLAFTLIAIANFVALGVGADAPWLGYIAVIPLLLLLPTGIYLFVLPYLAKGKKTATP